MYDYLKVLPHGELIKEFKNAVENLPGSGAAGRNFYYSVEAELLKRLNEMDED